MEYRKVGATLWKHGPPLFRVEKGPFKGEGGKPRPSALAIPEDAHLFAGSVLRLDPDTAYELRLTLDEIKSKNKTAGQSGAGASKEESRNEAKQEGRLQKILTAHTLGEPIAPADMTQRHVVPGQGGGTGTKADPFRGLKAADLITTVLRAGPAMSF